MMQELLVKSAVIDWPSQKLEITTTAGAKHVVPLNQNISVDMIGYPDREKKDMAAGELGDYMRRGYILEKITFEEEV